MLKDAADMYNCLMSGAHLIYDYNEFSNLLRQPINVQRKVPRKFTPMDFARECQFAQTQTIFGKIQKKGLLSAAKYFYWTVLRIFFLITDAQNFHINPKSCYGIY